MTDALSVLRRVSAHNLANVFTQGYRRRALYYIRFANQRGFFGGPEDGAPALTAQLHRHIRFVWRDEWQACEVVNFALANLSMCNRLSRKAANKDLRAQVNAQAVRVVACVVIIGELPSTATHTVMFEPVAQIYETNSGELDDWIQREIALYADQANGLLDDWMREVVLSIAET